MIYKRGRIYWYKFTFNGEAIRESTRQKNQHTARQMEAAHRASLAKGEVGIREKKVIPTLKSFCIERVEPWAKSTFEQASPKTWLWYGFGIDSLKKSATLANLKLDEVGPELVAEFASERQRDGLQISSVNSCLRALRRILRLAVEWGVLESLTEGQIPQRGAPARKGNHSQRRGTLSRGCRAALARCFGCAFRHRNTSRRVPLLTVGTHQLGWRSQRSCAGRQGQDESRPTGAAHETASSHRA